MSDYCRQKKLYQQFNDSSQQFALEIYPNSLQAKFILAVSYTLMLNNDYTTMILCAFINLPLHNYMVLHGYFLSQTS